MGRAENSTGSPQEESTAAPLIGRRLELDVLVEAIKGGRAGRSVAVLVKGDAGVGKSRLLREAMTQADLLGFRVLATRVDELDRGLPYAALRDALGPALESEHDHTLRAAVEELRAALLLAVPTRSSLLSHREALQAAHASGERLLRVWAEREPLVLAIDDLHACDSDTLALMSVLLRRLAGSRCVFIGTLRDRAPDVPNELEALIERLDGAGLVRVVGLGPLDPDDTRALARSMLGGPPDDALADVLWDKCRGNALLLDQILSRLVESGAVVADLGRFCLVGDPPVVTLSARSALLHRVFELGRHSRDLVRVLTLFSHVDLERLDVAADLAGLGPAEASVAFDQLVDANLLTHQRDSRYEFTHPVVRDTLYDDLGAAERRRLHGALASHLRRQDRIGRAVSLPELAIHVAASATPGDDDAVALLRRAGDDVASTAPGTAAEWYGRALALLRDDDSQRPGLLTARARALALASRFEESTAAAQEAIAALPPGPERQSLEIRAMSNLIALGRFDDALRLADESIEELRVLGVQPHPRLLERRASVLMITGRLEEAESAARQTLDVLGDDAVTRTLALGTLAAVAFNRGRMAECIALFDDQQSLAAALPGTHLTARVTRGSYLAMAGHVREARTTMAEAKELAATTGTAAYQGVIDTGDVFVGWLAGEWDRALDNAGRARLVLSTSGQRYTLGLVAGVEAAILLERGRYRDAGVVVESIGHGLLGASFLAWARGGILLGSDDVDAARTTVTEAVDRDQAFGRLSAMHLLLDRLVDVELRSGQIDGARRAAEQLMRLADHGASPWVSILAKRAVGRSTRDAEALREAAVLADDEELPFEAAVSRLEIGCLLSDAGALRSAHSTFDRLGAEPWKRRTAAELRARGLRVATRRRSRGEALSDTERELARLVRDGHTNRQIASILCLSPKTIEAYLTRLYERTGCASRLDLALAVQSGRVAVEAE